MAIFGSRILKGSWLMAHGLWQLPEPPTASRFSLDPRASSSERAIVLCNSRGGVSGWTVMIILLSITALFSWRWQVGILNEQPDEKKVGRWEAVKEEYPLPLEPEKTALLEPAFLSKAIEANPFSPLRRNITLEEPDAESTAPEVEPEPLEPEYVYKGHIQMGQRERAIVEDVTSGKTHFLEVGQQVAGVKVLDITENQVILSDLGTNEKLVISLTSSDL